MQVQMATQAFDAAYTDAAESDSIWARLGQLEEGKTAGQVLESLWASVAPRQTPGTLKAAVTNKLAQGKTLLQSCVCCVSMHAFCHARFVAMLRPMSAHACCGVPKVILMFKGHQATFTSFVLEFCIHFSPHAVCWLPLLSILKAVHSNFKKAQGKFYLDLARPLQTLFHACCLLGAYQGLNGTLLMDPKIRSIANST